MSWTHCRRNHKAIKVQALAVCLIVAAGGAGCSSSVLDLTSGDCFNQPESEEVTNISTVSCTEEHNAEVVGTTQIQQNTMPDEASLNDFAQRECLTQFETYVGIPYPESSLDMTWLVPTAASWEQENDRTVTCLALAPQGGTLKQSVKDLRQ